MLKAVEPGYMTDLRSKGDKRNEAEILGNVIKEQIRGYVIITDYSEVYRRRRLLVSFPLPKECNRTKDVKGEELPTNGTSSCRNAQTQSTRRRRCVCAGL
jgi:hypothetical protein